MGIPSLLILLSHLFPKLPSLSNISQPQEKIYAEDVTLYASWTTNKERKIGDGMANIQSPTQ